MNPMLRYTLSSLALCPALLAQTAVTATGAIKVADLSNREARPPVMPNSEAVTLKATLDGLPTWDGLNGVLGGTCTVREKVVAVLVGKSKADLEWPDRLAIDLDGDGKFNKHEQLELTVEEQKGRGNTKIGVGKAIDCTLKLGGVELPAKVGVMARGDTATASLQFSNYLEATVKLGDVEQTIAIVDKDQDGTYGSAGDLWTARKAGDNNPTSAYGLSGMRERRFDKDQLLGISVKDKVVQVTATPATAPDAKDAAAHRERVEKLWHERFDKDRAEFYKARQLDESRPLATAPIQWHYVSFDEGLAMAKKSGKPLFIDVMAFWCVWCYRMDYTTYPDKEVAELLNGSFVPVKLIQEQDLAGDYKKLMDKLEARGIPAMGIFDGDGNKLHFIGGWNKPEDFVKELQTALDAAKAKK